jgi:hypothetical protein
LGGMAQENPGQLGQKGRGKEPQELLGGVGIASTGCEVFPVIGQASLQGAQGAVYGETIVVLSLHRRSHMPLKLSRGVL